MKAVEVTSILILLILSIFTLIAVFIEHNQAKEFKKYENYIHYNKLYSEWYATFAERKKHKGDYSKMPEIKKADVRAYFNLYRQEYYMYKHDMIPKEMWEKAIHGTDGICNTRAMIDINRYRILKEGYIDWKKAGEFSEPADFKKDTRC